MPSERCGVLLFSYAEEDESSQCPGSPVGMEGPVDAAVVCVACGHRHRVAHGRSRRLQYRLRLHPRTKVRPLVLANLAELTPAAITVLADTILWLLYLARCSSRPSASSTAL